MAMKRRKKRVKHVRSAPPTDLFEAMKVHLDEMSAELTELRRFRPLLSLQSDALRALLDLVPHLRHRPGRQKA